MEKEEISLRSRFLYAIRHVNIYLKLTGVDLNYQHGERGYKTAQRWIWGGFWLFSDTQSGIFIAIRRKTLEKLIALFSSSAQLLIDGQLMDHLNDALMSSSDFFFENGIHYILVWTIRSTLSRFFYALEPVDARLRRPKLDIIEPCSIACLMFTASIVRYMILRLYLYFIGNHTNNCNYCLD